MDLHETAGDLNFADNISLLSPQTTTCTRDWTPNQHQEDQVKLQQENIKEVENFVYLHVGSVINKDGETDEDIKC